MPPKQQKPQPLPDKLAALSKSPQFYWYLGHALGAILFLILQIVSFFGTRWTNIFYRLVLICELISYGIVAYQLNLFKKTASKKMQWLQDENGQYLFFAVSLFVSSFKLGAWTKALYSFAIYSFFHAIAYFQSNILESFPIPIAKKAAWSDRITYISSNYNQQALYFAAMNEVFLLVDFLWIFPRLLTKLFFDPIFIVFELLLFVSLIIFLKLRYTYSTYTITIISQLDQRITGFLSIPGIPQSLLQFYIIHIKGAISSLTSRVPTGAQISKKNE